MTYRVELTNRAKRDLRQIYQHIHAEDSEQAIAWFNGLESAVYSLAEHPDRCPVTPENKKLLICFTETNLISTESSIA